MFYGIRVELIELWTYKLCKLYKSIKLGVTSFKSTVRIILKFSKVVCFPRSYHII